jgi:hypothetical protein
VFPEDFAADVPKPLARFMAMSQVPIAGEIFDVKIARAAWKDKPSFAVIPKDDRMINPELHRFMTNRAGAETIELPGSHAIFLSHASEVAALIEKRPRLRNRRTENAKEFYLELGHPRGVRLGVKSHRCRGRACF